MLAEEIQKLEEENERLKKELIIARYKLKCLKDAVKYIEGLNPEKLYITKSRRNTTLKFRDGQSITVKRKLGEKDCVETAIAYCVTKHLLNNCIIKKLIKEAEYHE